MTAAQGSLGYRADVDGLRAIAVGIVVLFHAKLGLLPGGYIGVDVFFVISGFLISSIIWQELSGGSFSFAGFYDRRIRRIFPALAVVMLATLALGAIILAPQDYFMLAKSARATALFISNFHFNGQFGYFMPDAEAQPLLHTWSLAVEEQFYLVAPLFLIALARVPGGLRLWLFAGLFALSFATSAVGAYGESMSAFYLPHSRAWELMCGMALALGFVPRWANQTWREVAGVLGVLLIAGPAAFYSDTTPFPGFAALAPCVGTALLISCGAQGSSMVTRALSHPALVSVGKVSYSLYLWHWPLFVFAAYAYDGPVPVAIKIVLILAATALSYLTYAFVEQPARSRKYPISRGAVIGLGLAAMAVVAGLSQGVLETKGWPQRLAPQVAAFANEIARAKLVPPCRDPDEGASSAAGCTIGARSGEPAFLFWGDSHGIPMAVRVDEIAKARGIRGSVAVAGGCAPLLPETFPNPLFARQEKCRVMAARVAAMLKERGNRHVVIAARWPYYFDGVYSQGGNERDNFGTGDRAGDLTRFAAALRATVEAIVATGRTVTLVGPVPELKFHVPNAMIKAMMHGRARDLSLPRVDFEQRQAPTLAMLETLATLPGVRVVYPHKVLCDALSCRTAENGKPLYFDDDHLNAFGTRAIEAVLAAAISP